jgi:hypothetical protein
VMHGAAAQHAIKESASFLLYPVLRANVVCLPLHHPAILPLAACRGGSQARQAPVPGCWLGFRQGGLSKRLIVALRIASTPLRHCTFCFRGARQAKARSALGCALTYIRS